MSAKWSLFCLGLNDVLRYLVVLADCYYIYRISQLGRVYFSIIEKTSYWCMFKVNEIAMISSCYASLIFRRGVIDELIISN